MEQSSPAARFWFPGLRFGLVDEIGSLLLRARDGDRWAFAGAVRLLQADLWRLAVHLTGPTEAEDVVQDAFVRLWGALGRYRGEASGRTYALAIARRACADALRHRSRRRRLAERVAAQPQDLVMADAAGELTLVPLLGALDEDRRVAFVLTQVMGLAYEEAAGVCGVPVGTIRSRVARAREQLLAAVERSDATG